MPIPIMKHYKEGLDQIARDPFPVYLEPSERTRAKIAKGYGADLDEIAISRNTTDAVSMILNGIDWQKGDELLTSTIEYPNCVAIMLHLASRFGVRIRQFGVPMQPDSTAAEVVEAVRRQIRPGKTRVLFFSCPANPNGQVLPARMLAELAQLHGITTVVDGAHYGGMFVPELARTGIDFWGIAGHKWQCGPGGGGGGGGGRHGDSIRPQQTAALQSDAPAEVPPAAQRPARRADGRLPAGGVRHRRGHERLRVSGIGGLARPG